jgi:S1-C subfamily serine protease
VIESVKGAVAYIEGKSGSGTAFLVRPGILVTNNHVLQDEYIDNLRARFVSFDKPNAEALRVKLLYRDRRRDLALLALQSDQKPLGLAIPKGIREGDAITVIGHPGRHEGVVTELHAVTEGNVNWPFADFGAG